LRRRSGGVSIGNAGATAGAASTSCGNGPSAIGNAECLRWRHAQGFMSAAEVVMCNVQRDCRNVIIKLLAKAIG
jgi:hypothetical protein